MLQVLSPCLGERLRFASPWDIYAATNTRTQRDREMTIDSSTKIQLRRKNAVPGFPKAPLDHADATLLLGLSLGAHELHRLCSCH